MFLSGGVACGDALSDTLRLMLCKGRLHIFPLDTATVIRCDVAPAATALSLLPLGRVSTAELGAPARNAPGRVFAVTLRVSEALAALLLH